MKTKKKISLLLFVLIMPLIRLAAQTNKEDAVLIYQLAQEEFEKANYPKVIEYLDKVENLYPEMKTKTSYLKAKCFFNTLPESFAARDKKVRELRKVNYHSSFDKCSEKGGAYINYVTYSDMFINFNKKEKIQNIKAWSICDRVVSNDCFKLDFTAYSKCMEYINYYTVNGKDEEKKIELQKIKIQIEYTDEYNLVVTTELCNLGYEAQQKGDFLEAKKYYEKSRDFCKFKPLYFNPLFAANKNECCFFPNFDMDLAIESMNKKIMESGK